MAVKINYTKNGNGYFRVTATIGRDSDGKPIRKEFYGTGKADSVAKRDEYLNNIKNGLTVNYKDMTLGKLIHSWLFEKIRVSNKIKPSTFQRYEGIYRNYIEKSKLYGLMLSDIKSIQIQRYFNELNSSGKSSNIIKNLNKLLKTFFNYVIDEGYLLKNPCSSKKIVIPGVIKNTDNEVEVFTDNEIKVIQNNIEGHRLKCLILLDLGTGLRQGELLGLKESDIDLENMELRVSHTIKQVNIIAADGTKEYKTIEQIPKTEASLRTVPIPSKLKPIIEDHFRRKKIEQIKAGLSYIKNDYVFTTEIGTTIDARNLTKSYKRILKKANVPYRKFHALRHTYATKLFEKDVPLKTIQTLLGHSYISITASIYTHVLPKKKTDAAEQLNSLFI